MKEEQWFSDLCFLDFEQVNHKSLKKTVNQKASEVLDQLKSLYKSNKNQAIFSVATDDFKLCQDALVLTLFFLVDTKKTRESKKDVIKTRIQQGKFDDDAIEKAYASIPVIFRENKDGKNKSLLDDVYSENVMNNFNPWSAKIKNPKIQIPNFPTLPEIFTHPPIGMTTRSYGFYIDSHSSNAGSMSDLTHIFNVKIKINGYDCPIQAILKGAIYNDCFEHLLSENETLNSLSYALIQKQRANSFGSIKKTHMSGDICLLVDEFDGEEIEISPMTSIFFYENYLQTHNKVKMSGCYIKGEKKRPSINIGNGQPQNIGAFASNTAGNIQHGCQSDVMLWKNKNSRRELWEMAHRKALLEHKKYIAKSKNTHESEYNYEERKKKGYDRAINIYLKKIKDIRLEINDLIDSQVEGFVDYSSDIFKDIQFEILRCVSGNDKKIYELLKNVVLNSHDKHIAVQHLAKNIFVEASSSILTENMSMYEHRKYMDYIENSLWRKYVSYTAPL